MQSDAHYAGLMEWLTLHMDAAQVELDPMTKGPTMHTFHVFAQSMLEWMPDDKLADILYFNIEDFKSYNEKFGFEKGNELIHDFGAIIAEVFEERIVARAFGDQFVALCYDSEAIGGIRAVNQKMQKLCPEFPINIKVGIYLLRDRRMRIALACDRAKIATDSIKRQHGVLYRVYDHKLDDLISRQRYIIEHIDEAIAKGRIKVFYQPVIRTLTQEVCGMEALARWDDPKYGLIAPDAMIGTLEEYQLIDKLDVCIIENVCREFEKEAQLGHELVPVSLNLSRLDFELCDIQGIIDELVEKYHVPKNMIHLEITESIFNKNPEYMKEQIRDFHRDGYEVWMDDFGSGYSSLNILKDYEFDVIKIDMLFLRNFDDRSKKIIAAIVDMAKRLGIRTLAEGVETQEQLDFLRNIGCEKAQGYLIGKPQLFMATVENLTRNGYDFEQRKMRKYYDDLGMINLLSTRPLELSSGAETQEESDIAQGIPIAIWEFRGDQGRFLLTNRSFRKMLNSIGVFSPRAAEFDANDCGQDLYRKVRRLAEELMHKDEIGGFNYVVNGNYCAVKARCVSTFDGGSAFLVTAQNLSESYEVGRDMRTEDIAPTLYSMFDMIDILYPDKNVDEPIFVRNTWLQNMCNGTFFSELKADFRRLMIDARDLDRFDRFMNMDSVVQRIEGSMDGVIEDVFRIREENGNYCWKLFSLGLIRKGERDRLLFCSRDASFREIEDYENLEIGTIRPRVVKSLKELSVLKHLSETDEYHLM